MSAINAYSFHWLESLDQKAKNEIFQLTNVIIQETNTIGFCKTLSKSQGMKMLSSLDQELKMGTKHLLILRKGSLLIGHALVSPNKLPNCRHRAEISRVMVHPNHRSYLLLLYGLQQLIKKSKKLGICSLELDVRAYTSLSRLWQKLGFEIIGENPDYVKIGIQTFKGFYMRQSITELESSVLHEISTQNSL